MNSDFEKSSAITYLLNYEPSELCKKLLSKQLERLGIDYEMKSHLQLQINDNPNSQMVQKTVDHLSSLGIKVYRENELALVDQIKIAIDEMILNDKGKAKKVSVYLSERLKYSYPYLALHFSEHTHNSIEKYMILRRVELVKNLILKDNLSLTEIAYKLDYSSVAHLSRQFKKMTGLTPTSFKKVVKSRNLKRRKTQ